jgi:DNA/RNA-binding domain of Phe-tRNA-synthetase-like protein
MLGAQQLAVTIADREFVSFCVSIDPAIWRLRADYAALSVVVREGRNAPSDARGTALLAAAREDTATAAAWAELHLESWRDAYKAFGAKPQRTPCSAEALRRRNGALPAVNRLVDIYNALSLRFAVPIGGEDLTAYHGPPRLTVAAGGEPFETVRDGMAVVKPVDRGEVVWRDERGVTCRRWNWRQSPRTRLEVHSAGMWFVVERLEPMPLTAVEQVGAALADAVRALAPGAEIEQRLIRPPVGG